MARNKNTLHKTKASLQKPVQNNQPIPSNDPKPFLSEREILLFQMLFQGYTIPQMAQTVNFSSGTVGFYLINTHGKLGNHIKNLLAIDQIFFA
ncbi:MAG: LuxR C-terminal-related transcriptional regulator [Gammaproteobacteria bacterium]